MTRLRISLITAVIFLALTAFAMAQSTAFAEDSGAAKTGEDTNIYGTCNVYVFAQNGVMKIVKVTVK